MSLVWILSAAVAVYALPHVPKLVSADLAKLAALWRPVLTSADRPPSRWARASYAWRRLYVRLLGVVAIWMLVSYLALIALRCGWWARVVEVGR